MLQWQGEVTLLLSIVSQGDWEEEKRNRAGNGTKGKQRNDPSSYLSAHTRFFKWILTFVGLPRENPLFSHLNISVIPFMSLKKGRKLRWVFICSLEQVRLRKVVLLLSRY